jgi:hypothetical protein
VSTGRSIHALPSIAPSPTEGIEDGSRLRQNAFQSRSAAHEDAASLRTSEGRASPVRRAAVNEAMCARGRPWRHAGPSPCRKAMKAVPGRRRGSCSAAYREARTAGRLAEEIWAVDEKSASEERASGLQIGTHPNADPRSISRNIYSSTKHHGERSLAGRENDAVRG